MFRSNLNNDEHIYEKKEVNHLWQPASCVVLRSCTQVCLHRHHFSLPLLSSGCTTFPSSFHSSPSKTPPRHAAAHKARPIPLFDSATATQQLSPQCRVQLSGIVRHTLRGIPSRQSAQQQGMTDSRPWCLAVAILLTCDNLCL